MNPEINRYKRTDYINQLPPRRLSSGLAAQPLAGRHPVVIPNLQAPQADSNDKVTISISINLPDYNQWRVTKFVRQYPYLSIGLAAAGLILLLLIIQGLAALWHTMHIHPLKPATIYQYWRQPDGF